MEVNSMSGTGLNEFGRLRRVVMKHPREAFLDEQTIAREWRALNFTAPPDFARAVEEYESLLSIIRAGGAEISFLPARFGTGLDSIYVRDASIVSPGGMVIGSMGKELRSGEPAAQEEAFRELGVTIAGSIRPPGRLEGGDLVWLNERTVIVGEGYRTNAAGIGQLRELLGTTIDDVIVVPLPHWQGAGEVLHLMSLISPVDRDLAVVYPRLMPVPFFFALLERGVELVEVPDQEFDTMGSNVLALAPRQCVMLSGNPRTQAALEKAGATVHTYDGVEISTKGAGGPTCLTRPLVRD
jgi:N-dimethylarginine dimethylaminohydrolase